MKDENNMDQGRKLQEIKDSPQVYHFEYTNIHNQRIALVRLIHLWHQIGFSASLVVYGFFFGYGASKSLTWFIFIGGHFKYVDHIFYSKIRIKFGPKRNHALPSHNYLGVNSRLLFL